MNKKPEESLEHASYERCLEILGSNINGLSEADVALRLNKYGPNKLSEKKGKNPILIFLSQFKSPLVYILIVAAIISIIAEGNLIEFYIIVGILLINAVIGFLQEWKAEKTIRSIYSLLEEKAIVIREGDEMQILVEDIVPGDIIILSAGQKVPADARILFERNLHADESLLTGESIPLKKDVLCLIDNPHYYEQTNMVFAGSFITEGRGRVIVTTTGNATVLGKIHQQLTEIKETASPMAIRTKRLSLFFLFFALMFFGINIFLGLYRGIPPDEITVLALASLVSSIPEGLIAVLTVVLSIGVYRLAKQNVIVRNLGIVETLGITNIICSDKTGTLTKNEMMVRRLYAKGHLFEVSGAGYDLTSGGIYLAGYGPKKCLKSPGECNSEDDVPPRAHIPIKGAHLKNYPELEKLLTYLALCNDAEVYAECEEGVRCIPSLEHGTAHIWKIKGSPTEAALIVALEKTGLRKYLLDEMWPRISEIPFSSNRKYMATLHEPGSILYENLKDGKKIQNKNLLIIKGAPERLQKFVLEMPIQCISLVEEFASQGLRVLACAVKYVPSSIRQITEEDLMGIELVGLVGINDPPREGVSDYIQKCKQAGISVRMITGDNELTAKAIAKEIGLLDSESEDSSLTGGDLDRISDEELPTKIANKIKVFSRTDPIHKLRIVKAFQENGSIVAMTGDGINDSPALKQANIGIAMGITGTDISKEAADVVLQDERFEAIVDGIDQGRHIFNNFRRVALYLFSTNLGEDLLLVLTFLIFIHPIFLLPIQILWINLVTDGFLDIALAMEPKEKGLLQQPPGSLKRRILSKNVIQLGLFYALIMTSGTLFVLFLFQNSPTAKIRTAIFLVLIIFQWFNAFNCRSQIKSVFTIGFFKNRILIIFLFIDIILVAILFFIPPLSLTFGLVPLRLSEWLLVVAIGASIWVLDEVRKKVGFLKIKD
ncbi:MAG TPA: HAD-IC family P-type ATPase [Candidatus Deferrimicrobium sp.]|nr:HAD-IC family P-type ATPase [Candidatus Deferrimicrobium sp.]